MMNKILSKTVRKTTLLATIFTIILAAAIVVCSIFGFNLDKTLKDHNTLTVSLNTFAYQNEKDTVIDECKDVFDGTQYDYIIEGDMEGDTCELIFVFDKGVDVERLDEKVSKRFEDIQAKALDENNDEWSEEWASYTISVSAATEETTRLWANGFVWRSSLALVAFVVLTFAYAAIRNKKWTVGVAAACSVAAGILLTGSLIVLTRVYITVNLPSIIAIAGLMTAATVFFTYGKIRAKQKEDSSISNEEAVLSSIPAKGILWANGALAVMAILLGIVGRTTVAWFATAMLLGILASTCVAFFLAPAVYLSLKSWEDKRPVKNGYVGAKKTSKKEEETEETVEE